MTRKSFVIVAIVYHVFLTIFNIDGLPTKDPKSVKKDDNNDDEICPTGDLFRSSNYTKICKNMNFSTVNETLGDKNVQQFLCLGVDDRILRICYLGSRSELSKNSMPNDSAAFDALVKNFIPKDDDGILNFCKNWKNAYPPLSKKTASYVVQLERDLKKLPTCLKICSNFDGQFEPLCAVLASIDEISNNKPIVSEKSDPSSPGGETKETAEITKKIKDAGRNDKQEQKIEDKKIEAPTADGKNTPDGSTTVRKDETKVDGSADRSTELEEPKSEITEAKVEKPTVVKPVEPQTAKIDTTKDTAKNLGTVDATADKTDSKNSPNDPDPSGDDNGAGIGGETSKDTEKSSTLGKIRIDQNTDIISERTQDEEPLGGGNDPSDDAVNEIESPILPISNEDINDSPAISPEKQEYVPRLPNNDDDSHFFGYITVIGVIFIAGYVGYHNKQKILAMVLEGRRSRGGRGRRRPSTANYRKLDCTLEEAVTSQCNSNVTHVIY